MPDGNAAQSTSQVLQLALGFVFLLGAMSKLRQPGTFTRTVVRYRLLPSGLTSPIALGLIGLESFLAVSLLTGWGLRLALPVAVVSLLIFSAAVAINLRRGRRIPCGCFGDSSEVLSVRTLVRLSMLLTAAAMLLVLGLAGTQALTVGLVVAGGWAGLVDALESAALAAFLLMLGLWVLNLPEVMWLLRVSARLRGEGEPPQDVEAV
jgi:Methylamine utilisation protein MauE